MHHIDSSVAITLLATWAGISPLFVYCYFGKQATSSYEQMGNCLYNLNWIDLPIKLQKNLIVMIANMQKPIHYHGFKFAILDLKTFIQVRISNEEDSFNLYRIYLLDGHC